MSYAKINEILNQGLKEINEISDLVIFENEQSQKKDVTKSFIVSKLQPANAQPFGAGQATVAIYEGSYRVNIFSPSGQGAHKANNYADLIVNKFTWGRTFSKDNINIHIRTSFRDEGFTEESNWFRVPVIIDWFAFISKEDIL